MTKEDAECCCWLQEDTGSCWKTQKVPGWQWKTLVDLEW